MSIYRISQAYSSSGVDHHGRHHCYHAQGSFWNRLKGQGLYVEIYYFYCVDSPTRWIELLIRPFPSFWHIDGRRY